MRTGIGCRWKPLSDCVLMSERGVIFMGNLVVGILTVLMMICAGVKVA